MQQGTRELAHVLRWVEEVGAAVLDEDLSELTASLDLDDACTLLDFAAMCQAWTLDELVGLEDQDLRHAVRGCSSAELEAVADAITRLVVRHVNVHGAAALARGTRADPPPPEDARPRLGDVPEPPRDDAELRAWVEERCPAGVLDRPATVVRPFYGQSWMGHALAAHTRDLTVDRCMPSPAARIAMPGHLRHQLLAAVRKYLHAAAHQQRLSRWRGTAWGSETHSVPLAALSELVREELRRLPDETAVVPEWAELYVVGDPPAVVLRVTGAHVEVGLSSWEVGQLVLRADGVDDATSYLRWVLETVVDAAHDRWHPLRPELLAAIADPVWSRLVGAIDGRDAGGETKRAAPGRVGWRVLLDGGRILPIHQKRTKTGRWSKGARKSIGWLMRDEVPDFATELDHRIGAELTTARERGYFDVDAERGERARWTRVVATLARHPLVHVDDASEPVEVRVDPLSFVIAQAPGGFEVRVTFGGRTWTAATLLRARPWPWVVAARDEGESMLHLRVLDEGEQRLLRVLADYQAILPRESIDRVLASLVRAAPGAVVELPDALAGRSQPADGRVVVRVAPRPLGGARIAVGVRPVATGALLTPGAGARNVLAIEGDERVTYVRDLDEERARALATCERAGLDRGALGPDAPHELADDEGLLEVLDRLRGDEGTVVEWPEGELPRSVVGSVGRVEVTVQPIEQWLGVDGEAEVDGRRVRLRDLLRVARRGGRFVALGDGRYARVEDELRRRLHLAGEAVFEHGRDLGIGLATADVLQQLVDDEREVRGREHIAAALAKMEAGLALDPALPAGLTAELRDYQREGFVWLARLAAWGLGGCLADDMGLGKTLQALALLVHRATEGPALVVAPTSVVDNWRAEADRFAPSLGVSLYRGPDREARLSSLGPADVLVTSYDILLRDAEVLAAQRFGTLVLDEAQAIKNASSKRARAAARLDAGFRVALTGTPLENHLGELWSIFHAVQPGLLGPARHFREAFAKPIEKYDDRAALERLRTRLRPFLLRRTKAEVETELPARTDVVRRVTLGRAERAAYDAARDDALERLSRVRAGDPEAHVQVLAELLRLRQLACNPRLIDPSSAIGSAKLALFEEICDELLDSGHRALVFSQFTRHLALVRERLEARAIRYLYLDGSTPAARRRSRIDSFQAGEAPLFLISLKAGGTGLNLTAADYVVHLDPWWNPAAEDQASDRAHRIGQRKPVTVVRLVSKDTIEEAVYDLHARKRDLAEALLAGAAANARLSTSELVTLVRDGASAP